MKKPPLPRLTAALLSLAATSLVACGSGAEEDPRADPPAVSAPASSAPSPSDTAPTGGASDPESTTEASRSPKPPPPERPTIEHVVAVSVDGLTSQSLTRLGSRRAPTFARLIVDGASTLDARSTFERSITIPNHTSMLTGRRVDLSAGGHGVTFNDDPGNTIDDVAGGDVDSVFDVVHDSGGSTALFTSKEKFAFFGRSWASALDDYTFIANNQALASAAVEDIVETERTFTFLHFSAPDVAGHARGWLSPAYLNAVSNVDGYLGQLLRAVEAAPGLADSTAFIITADHGGDGPGHSEATTPSNFTIPFFVIGPNLRSGDLYDLDPVRRDPGTGRPDYEGDQPVRNADVANLATGLLGLPPVSGSYAGLTQDLSTYLLINPAGSAQQ